MTEPSRPVRTVLRERGSELQPTSEQRSFERSSRCPRCRKLLLYSRTYEYGGKVSRIRTPQDPAALAECPRCNQRWFFYRQPAEIEFIETHQTVEVFRTEEIVLDNAGGTSSLNRRRTVAEEWSQSYDLEREQTASSGTKLSMGIDKGPSAEVTAEQSLKERFAISEQKKRSFTEELALDVPPGIVRTVTLRFKRTWQHGTINVNSSEGSPLSIPFKVVVDVGMDVAQTDAGAR